MRRHRQMQLYAGALLAVALLLGGPILRDNIPTEPWPLIALFVLTLVLSNLAVELPFAVSLSFTFAPIFAGILQAGPAGGALLGVASAVSFQEVREHKPPVLMLVNVCQLFIAGLLAGWVHVSISEGLDGRAGQGLSSLGLGFVAPGFAVAAFFLLNLLLVGVALSLKTGIGWADTLRALSPGSYWVSLLVLALLGYVMAQLISIQSWFGLLLLVLPFTMARRTFRVYVELTEAYTSTVRSLVTAIEAKDPYTRGHSERVADYACRLGERMGMPTAEIDLIERAALLHDVGKIGISLDTLVSPEKLTPDEVNAIRQHPALGSDLVGDVEFLSDIVDVVRHHHERCDGAGYPDGLVGERISIPARILAIADAYDAMTSDRAYRPRMTDAQARDELHRVADSQLDGDLVRQFTTMLSEDRVEGASA